MKINDTIKTMLNHRSIRKWKEEKVSDEILETLFNVANRTSTSIGMQTASIIRITDKEKRAQIAEITTQNYVNEAPEFWVFIADHFRNNQILEEANAEKNFSHDIDRFFSGVTDAALMAQNVANAIESLGMGFVFFGSVLNDPEKLVEILELPKYTMPVLGLGFGYPDQDPKIKPRMNYENRIFENKYKIYDNYHEIFKEYDKVMDTYYDLRNTKKTVGTFTEQAVQKYSSQQELRQKLIEVARMQGYDL